MNNLYGGEFISKLKKERSNSIKLIVVIMLAATIVNICSLLLSNEYNELVVKIIASVIYVGAGWSSLWILFIGVLTRSKKLDVIEELNCCDDVKDVICKVVKVEEPLTLTDTIKYYVITATVDDKEIKLYFDALFDVNCFSIGSEVNFKVADGNYVIAYEVQNNGK